ncbi:hypothetical protein [Bdellovibrio sp. HCB2-146]|uniref:hypothetical protein n=1 Tax=Bdellovibrio sp. HCB2-146 TaxID=3394362 RepID=UPI0039BCB02A
MVSSPLKSLCLVFLSIAVLFLSACVAGPSLVRSSERQPLPWAPYDVIYVEIVDPNVQVYARLNLKSGETFMVPKKPLRIRYADGQEVEVPIKISSLQVKTEPFIKYPTTEGYQYSNTSTQQVWTIQKAKKVVWGVIVDADQFIYDGRPKEESLELGATHEFKDPEDAFAERRIELRADFPNKKMNVEVEGFEVTVESTSYPAKRYNYDYQTYRLW